MKIYQKFFCLVLANVVCCAIAVYAQKSEEQPAKYRMELVYIFNEGNAKTEYVFVLNGSVGFKTITALKNFIQKLPPGSILEWRTTCDVMGDEPLLSSEKEMDAFKAFCKAKKIKFILGRSG